jgi:hypothetical protein
MIDRAVWAALTAFAGTIMNELKSGHKVRCHLRSVDHLAEGHAGWISVPAPKGASEFRNLVASLKRCPDTKLEYFGSSKAGRSRQSVIK